jgi:seryl-tRNA synthetase
MLLVNDIRQKVQEVKDLLTVKNFDAIHLVDEIIELDDQRKRIQTQRDSLLAERNQGSDEIGALYKKGAAKEADDLKVKINALKEEINVCEEDLKRVSNELDAALVKLPNLPHKSVPSGRKAEDNEIVFSVDKLPELIEGALPHWDLATKYDIIDFETAVKITGAGFTLFKGKGAVLQRALINFFLDQAIDAGYNEVVPPLLVNEASAFGTGQLPDKEGQMYYVKVDDFYLIPTAEVPITNIYRDVIVNEADLPIKLTGYTPCFRREAGSYGAHVRGLNRLHQFDKVEVVQITKPEESYNTLENMVKHVESILVKLELPYRILKLCGGDMGFASALTYDFEVYSAAQKKWLEVSSVSNFETFQANRLKLRYRDSEKKNQLCHTLNGSALALPRIIACLLENNQEADRILIPKALQPYTRFNFI